MKKITKDMSQAFVTDWIFLNNYKSIIDELSSHIRWTGALGTLDGTVECELLQGDDEASDYDTLYNLDITEASGRDTAGTGVDCIAVRYKYTPNGITAGSMVITLNASGK